MQQRLVRLDGVTHFVLDEADRMLDMGFVHDVRRVVAALPAARQTLFFSATIAGPIETLARTMLVNPARVSIAPTVTTAETRRPVGRLRRQGGQARACSSASCARPGRAATSARTLVFTRTKHGANRLSEQLDRAGIGSAAIHGNKTQGARERALEAFRRGTTRVLVATDVAARGIDVEGISLVVNFDLPNVAESYVHRIGRTGRAGASGRAISFCDRDERSLLVRHRAPDPPAPARHRRRPSTRRSGRVLPSRRAAPRASSGSAPRYAATARSVRVAPASARRTGACARSSGGVQRSHDRPARIASGLDEAPRPLMLTPFAVR